MFGWAVQTGLRFRRLLVVVAAGVLVAGVAQAGNLPKDGLPEFSPPTVEVQTEALGLSAAEVEQLITVPLEQDLLVGVAFLDEIESVSLPGLSSVVMTFEPGTDLLAARQVVQERLTQAVGVAGLPAVAKPPQMIQPLSSQGRVSMVRLTSDELSPIDMSVLSRWVIGPRLLGVPGVANVAIWGNRDRQLQVLVDPERLQANDVPLAQVVRTAGNALEVSSLSFLEASKPGTGGFIDTPNQRLNIFHEQAITSAEELAQVPLETADGSSTPVALGAVTDVVEDHQPLIGDAVCTGGVPCLLLVVEKFPGANTTEVTEGVEEALAALEPGLGGLQMDSSVYRPASSVESTFRTLGWTLAAGVVLMLLVIAAFFWSWRRLVVAVAAISVSAAVAVSVLALRGETVNYLVAAGLVLGLTAVVHEAVSDTQLLGARTSRRPGEAASPLRGALDACTERRSAIAFAVLIVAAATVPFFFMNGEADAFLPPIALSYLLAAAASILVALLLTPPLAFMLLAGRDTERPTSPVVRLVHGMFERRGERRVWGTRTALLASAAVAGVGLLALPFLDASLRPSLKERELLIHLSAAPGTSLPLMTEMTAQAVEQLEALPGVANADGHVGRAVMSDEDVDVSSGEIWVTVGDGDYDETVAAVESVVAGLPDLSGEVLTYSEERVTEVLGRDDVDLAVRIYGEDAGVRSEKATEIQALLEAVPGVAETRVDMAPDETTMEVEVDLARAQAVGIKPGDVRRAAATLLGGMTVGNLFDEQKVFDVVVWGSPEVRQDVADVEGLLIDTPDGGHVRLGEVADVRTAPNPTVIRHESVASYLDVTAEVGQADVGEVADAVDEVVDQVAFPLDHHAELIASDADQGGGLGTAAPIALAAALGILLLLQAAFGSWRLAALTFVVLPLALVGGVLAILATGATLTLGAIGGLVAVLGIVARDAVVLVRRYQQVPGASGTDRRAAVVEGTRDALEPILTSALAIAALLAPIVVLGPRPGFEILHPAAAVVLGGLVTATVVTLLILPALYLTFGSFVTPDTSTEDLFAPIPAPRPTTSIPSGAMQRVRTVLVPLAVPALMVAGCGGTIADAYEIEHEPAHVEPIEGSDLSRVVLEESAVERLQVQTAEVVADGDTLLVPTSATFVDTSGVWWVYTNPEPNVYVRHEIEVVDEQGDQALLSGGPPAGTRVVTVGVAEIAGVEDGVGH